MSKVICDICGTTYQEFAEKCPICGYTRDLDLEHPDEDVFEEDLILTRNKGGRFARAGFQKKKKEIFDYDEVNAEDEDEEEYEDDDDEDDEDFDEPRKSNPAVVAILVIVIMLLVASIGFLFLRYFLPNMLSDDDTQKPAAVETMPTETQTEATTEPTIPCQSIVLTGGIAELNKEGQLWLLHVKVMPEDTTDTLTYTSEDESIATVTVDGRITAHSEGATTIYITCGKQQINCPVVVRYVEETEPATEETVDATGETIAQTEAVEEDIVLKLKKYDISLTVGYGANLQLDCELDPSQVEWSVEHDFIATVDDKGFVMAVSYGTTAVTARYGDQEVTCIIRCK